MVNNLMNTSSVQRLKSILQNRYGKVLNISTMNEVTDINQESQSFQIRGNDMQIPIFVNSKFFATASVGEAANMTADEQLAVSYLVRMILEPTFYNLYLSRMSENASSLSSLGEETVADNNVVPLFESFNADSEDEFESLNLTSSVICLQAQNPYTIQKVANELHDITGRWAFLRYSEIQANVDTAKDLKDMGAVTLLIEDIMQLNPEMQASLAMILKSTSQNQDPLFIIGISGSLQDLQAENLINADLAKILSGHLLDVDRIPLEKSLFKQTLELFLEQDPQS